MRYRIESIEISIHALRAEGDGKAADDCQRRHISIHALRAEGDPHALAPVPWDSYFYPRPPCGGRLRRPITSNFKINISIHALRAEGDSLGSAIFTRGRTFLSTPSVRRATVSHRSHFSSRAISIHALRAEGDPGLQLRRGGLLVNFYPRPPCGGRLQAGWRRSRLFAFLSTPSVRRATRIRFHLHGCPHRFLSTPSVRRAT